MHLRKGILQRCIIGFPYLEYSPLGFCAPFICWSNLQERPLRIFAKRSVLNLHHLHLLPQYQASLGICCAAHKKTKKCCQQKSSHYFIPFCHLKPPFFSRKVIHAQGVRFISDCCKPFDEALCDSALTLRELTLPPIEDPLHMNGCPWLET